MRFTVRDFLWAACVLGLAIVAVLQHRENQRLRTELADIKAEQAQQWLDDNTPADSPFNWKGD